MDEVQLDAFTDDMATSMWGGEFCVQSTNRDLQTDAFRYDEGSSGH